MLLVESLCKQEGIKTDRYEIISAVKRVSCMFEQSCGGVKASSAAVVRPEKGDNGGSNWPAFEQYQKERNSQDKPLIAGVKSDVGKILDIPYVDVGKNEINEGSFGISLLKVLAESSGCIIFETESITSEGVSRICKVLADVMLMFDSRLCIFLKNKAKQPEQIEQYIEKNLDSPTLKRKTRRSSIPDIIDKKAKTSESNEKNMNVVEEKDREILELRIRNEKLEELASKRDRELEEKMQEQNIQIASLKAKVDKLVEDNRDCTDLAAGREADLNEEVGQLKSELESKSTMIATLVEEKFELEEQLDYLQKDKEILENKCHQMSAEKQLIEKKLKERESVGRTDSISQAEELTNNEAEKVKQVETTGMNEDISNVRKDSENLSEENCNQLKEVNSVAVRSNFIKKRLLKHSKKDKLSPREIVFRSIKGIEVKEEFSTKTETDITCKLKVIADNSELILNKVFQASGSSKRKSIMAAYEEIIKFFTAA